MKLSNHTALYSPLDIEYQQEYCGPFEDLSYPGDNDQIVVGLKDGKVSGFGRPMVCVGYDKFQKQQIERLWQISQDIEYMDFLVDGKPIVELKAIDKILPIHETQMITYLRLTGRKLGIILNFNVSVLRDGIKRVVLEL